MPNRDTPQKLVAAWLDFHQEKLCRDLDAVFAFDGQGMEIWCRSSQENAGYRKLLKILQPLRDTHQVELYSTLRPGSSMFARGSIPPSLLENKELRSSLRPHASMPSVVTVEDRYGNISMRLVQGPPERSLSSNIAEWANTVINNNRIMRQYAEDIPELIHVVAEPVFDTVSRRRALDICRKHVKELVKDIRDLNKKFSFAFPSKSVKAVESKAAKKDTKKDPPPALSAVIEKADGIAADAAVLSGNIYRFLYPAEHTVDIDDLQRPRLLVALASLEAEARDFEQALAKLPAS